MGICVCVCMYQGLKRKRPKKKAPMISFLFYLIPKSVKVCRVAKGKERKPMDLLRGVHGEGVGARKSNELAGYCQNPSFSLLLTLSWSLSLHGWGGG